MVDLPLGFTERMKSYLGNGYTEFINSYNFPVSKAIRVNTLKISVSEFRKISPFKLGDRVPWEQNGFYADGEGLGKTVLHNAGLYYVQEPSAMCAAPKLNVKRGERVLDLCAAPGGKSTQLAQSMQGEGVLVLNEINGKRADVLSSNVERLGVKNAVVTCATPEKLVENFTEYFDKILVDAPCSGEGMFKKEPSAVAEWSSENVRGCAVRQKIILDCADKMLAAEGRLVYSTCTFSPEEDERQVEDFLKTHREYELIEMNKLFPHEVRGEGHFYAVLEKKNGVRNDLSLLKPLSDKKAFAVYNRWAAEVLKTEFENLHLINNILYSLPEGFPRINVRVLRAGVRLGQIVNDRFEPSHSLAMCLRGEEVLNIGVDEDTAVMYLKGLTFDCAGNKGWQTVIYKNFPLGWCKVSGGVAKNRLPKGLRI